MEFTKRGRVRRRGLRMAGWALALEAVCGAWLVASGGAGWRALVWFMGVFAFVGFRGLLFLRGLRRPFRLVVDAWGVRLHDGELSWAQVESIGLVYPPAGSPDGGPGEASVPEPHLALWPVSGVDLPRKPDRTADGRLRYTLLDTDDLDQPLHQLTECLRQFGGDRVERLPS
ncbi:hypothetical protein ACFV5G_41455 [Streptomyces sp. NPDC059766]|uniref:hypothetical protein n=1 Tax=Streptomyces sp. NPDC059766 TaxID=3346940 RepID=UPI00365FDEA0